jgi:UrcA family protein
MRATILIAALSAATSSAPSIAHQPDHQVARIRIADLNLATARGDTRFRQRVETALEQLCGTYADPAIWAQDQVSSCRRAAKASIDRQVAAIRGDQLLAGR